MRQLRGQERAITGNRQTGLAFAEAYGAGTIDDATDIALRWSRGCARDAGIRTVSTATGAALRMLAATAGAKAIAEIGTGTGVSGIYLLHGMRPDGVLTTVDLEPQRQTFAKQAFREAGFAGNRARFIPGRALDVLPRLADGGYDLVFCDGDLGECTDYLAEALRLLRPGGLVCFAGSSPTAAPSTPARSPTRCCACASCCVPSGTAPCSYRRCCRSATVCCARSNAAEASDRATAPAPERAAATTSRPSRRTAPAGAHEARRPGP